MAALRKAEAYPPTAGEASSPVTRYAVRDKVSGLLFCNHSMHPTRKSWDGLETAQVYLKREAAEATALQTRANWEQFQPHHPTLYPQRLEPEVVEVQLTVLA